MKVPRIVPSLGAALLAAGALSACQPTIDAGKPAATLVEPPVPQTWVGVLPCADCPGIKTRLVLQSDGRFELRTQHMERQVEPRTVTGRFTWNTAGNAVVLDVGGQAQSFAVGEGRLLQLNRDGSPVAWNAPNRVLDKVSGP